MDWSKKTQKYQPLRVLDKGPVKLIQRVKIARSFLQCVKSVPLYHSKLAYVVLHMTVEESFEAHF